jgi:hypothetical protein
LQSPEGRGRAFAARMGKLLQDFQY